MGASDAVKLLGKNKPAGKPPALSVSVESSQDDAKGKSEAEPAAPLAFNLSSKPASFGFAPKGAKPQEDKKPGLFSTATAVEKPKPELAAGAAAEKPSTTPSFSLKPTSSAGSAAGSGASTGGAFGGPIEFRVGIVGSIMG